MAIGTLALAALTLAGIGLYLSFEHVAQFAHQELSFQTLGKAQLFVAGVDVGILVLIGLDLMLAWVRRPNRRIRYLVWLLTAATIVFNAASAAPAPGQGWKLLDYVAVGAHALVPVLFIAVVEIGRGVIERAVRPDQQDAPSAAVPLHRWLLAPASTARIYRRMRLWNAPSYQEVIREEQERTVYRSMLEREHGRWRKAPKDLQLPLRLAKFGLGVDAALAQPAEHKRRMADWTAQHQALELEEQERERLRQEAEADRQAEEAIREADRKARVETAQMRSAASVDTARHEVTAATSTAQTQAQAAVATAQRTAQLEAEAVETAALAEARARKAAADRQEAEARKAAAQADRQRAEEELRAARLRAEAGKAEQIAQAEMQAIETAEIAEARAREAAADRKKAEEELRAAKLRRQAAEADKAAELEDRAIETAKAAEARKAAAEAEEAAAEIEEAAAETRRRAAEAEEAAAKAEEEKKDAERRAAEAEEAAAEAKRRAAETRLAVAEIERRAVETEDEAKLTPRERAVRRVARMALTAGLAVDGLEPGEIQQRLNGLVSIADIQRELAVSSTDTASRYRQEAAELLAGGYRLPA
ncbi:DUF2637 domain-containing protein [Streptomyces sp. URMC 125]|uniref:DUF2637 domain-containing protein n=1 Tax=Streptomyces sp. URMC 125 TaxID=3423419 RepID=UPI003F1B11D0